MTDEIAIERLKGIDIKFFLNGSTEQSDYIVDEADKINVAIETVLNLIQKQQSEINSLNQAHRYDVNMIDEVKGEAVKLYKIIDEMAKEIREYWDNKVNCYATGTIEQVKYYFKRKVEDK